MTDKGERALQNYFQSHFTLSSEEINQIVLSFHPVTIHSGQHFLKAGDKANSIIFITEGIMRTHWLDEKGNDITNFFFRENQFLVPLHSYISRQASPVSIHAITICKLLIIQREDEQKLARELPPWLPVFNKIVQASLIRKVAHKNVLKGAGAKEKYRHFVNENGEIALRTPLQYIASYLEITPQSLSRIRRENY